MAQRPVTLADIIRGHVSLEIEGFDRLYFNGWVPALQTSGQIVGWLHWRGFPIASPAALGRNSQAFRGGAAVRGREPDPSVVFRKGDRKLEVIRPYLWPIPAAAVPRDDRPDAFLGHRAGRCS